MRKNLKGVSKLNNHELNNRLTNIVLPSFKTQTLQFTSDITLIENFLIKHLIDNSLLNDVLYELSKSEIKFETYNRQFCIFTLLIIITSDK